MDDKKLLKGLDELSQEWIKNKNTIDAELLTSLFKIEGGDILVDDGEKVAIGLLPYPEHLRIYFFQNAKDSKLKYVAERGIRIDDGSKALISQIIILCELRRNTDGSRLDNNFFQ